MIDVVTFEFAIQSVRTSKKKVLKYFLKKFLNNMNILFKRIFGCSHHNWKLVNRFPKTGVTDGRRRVWMIYYCPDCDRHYLVNNQGFFKKVRYSSDFGIKTIGSSGVEF